MRVALMAAAMLCYAPWKQKPSASNAKKVICLLLLNEIKALL